MRTHTGVVKAALAFVLVPIAWVGTIHAAADTLLDGFDDGVSSSRWGVFHVDAAGAPWTVYAPDEAGRLQLSKSADTDSESAFAFIGVGLRSRFTADGDFSVFVGFDLITFPLSNRHGYNEAIILVVSKQTGAVFECLRLATASYQYVEGWWAPYGVIGQVLDSTMSGGLGVARQGQTVSAWIDRGAGPELVGSLNLPEFVGPVYVQIEAVQMPSPNNNRPSTALDVRFDDLTVTAGTIVRVGDLNCDGSVDFGDINPFVLALTDWSHYPDYYPNCDIYLADINNDGYVDFGDINPFVALLTGR